MTVEPTPVTPRPPREADAAEASRGLLYVVATFTAEPLGPVIGFWAREMSLGLDVAFAPYNQLFQELLDPGSPLGQNRGVNAVVVRPSDWLRFRAPSGSDDDDPLRRNAAELGAALEAASARSASPIVFALAPDAPEHAADPVQGPRLAALRARLLDRARACPTVAVVEDADVARYAPGDPHDPVRDELGHVPFTDDYFAALGTAIARKAHALTKPAPKVIVLDCDNTLWRGVVGEDGPTGITCEGGHLALQRFAVAQQDKGMVLALASKNVEQDVLEVFEQRTEWPLRREHLVAWQVNWDPKPRNLAALAETLNVGIDSFVFLDDNPVEVAHVRAEQPSVIALELPPEPEIEAFLGAVWAFDVLKVTDEDRKRTAMYRQNAERAQFERGANDIAQFVAGLELQIDVAPPREDQIPRVAQLTQRTNQFNLTTIRRSEAEVRRLADEGAEVLVCEVRDRFGDYGLVGVMILRPTEEAIELDTMLLSCRVLGRGVEHAMLRRLGEEARARGKARVDVRFVPTRKNQPARNFVETFGGDHREEGSDGEVRYRIPAEVAAAASYSTGYAATQLEIARQQGSGSSKAAAPEARGPSEAHQRAAALRTARAVARAVADAEAAAAPPRAAAAAPPRDALEAQLLALWTKALRLREAGVHDTFTDAGGTSLAAATLFADVHRELGRKLPLTTILEHDTVAKLAARLREAAGGDGPPRAGAPGRGAPDPHAVPLRDGHREVVFFVHDGFGETLLYKNLADRLPEGTAVWGLEPRPRDGVPIAQLRIEQMAEDLAARVRALAPRGPYALAGLCAGGVLAFEMARRLEAAGEQVRLVAILDAAAPGARRRANVLGARRARSLQALLEGFEPATPLRSAGALARAVAEKAANTARWEVGHRVRGLADRARFRAARALEDRGVPWPALLRGLDAQGVYDLAVLDYRPAPLEGVPVVLVRATEGAGDDQPYRELYDDAALGWGALVPRDLRVVDVAGGHSSMLQGDRAEAIAAVLASPPARAADRHP